MLKYAMNYLVMEEMTGARRVKVQYRREIRDVDWSNVTEEHDDIAQKGIM